MSPSISTSTTNLFISLSKFWIESSCLSDALISSLTLRKSPLTSLFTVTILAMGDRFRSELSYDKTTSPVLEFLGCLLNFSWFCRVSSTFFVYQFQNSYNRCWILLQYFLYYQSSNLKLFGDDITTFDFIVRRFTGLK